jgi:hypothetical protein
MVPDASTGHAGPYPTYVDPFEVPLAGPVSDFPANPDHPDGDWVAETFLVAIPDVMRSSVLVPVAAFSWGYRLRNHRPVQLFPPEQLELSAWDARRDLLGSRHAEWTFEPTGTPI